MDDTFFGGSSSLMPIGTSMSDSEVDLLVQYISSKVANAPEYIDLGEKKWCYATMSGLENYTYLDELLFGTPLTVTCQAYETFKIFDYRAVLSDNNLNVIIAYAFQQGQGLSAYNKNVKKRLSLLRAVSIFIGVQIPLHLILLISGLLAYRGRGSAQDLRTIPKITLNAIAAISLVAGLTVTIANVIFVQSMGVMEAEVHKHLESYGISIHLGTLYFTFHWLVVGCSASCMLVWAVPLWCGNPPESIQWEEYEGDFPAANKSGDLSRDTFLIKPYSFDRTTQPKKKIKHSESRLFDESFEIPDNEEMVHMSDLLNPFENGDPDVPGELAPHSKVGSSRAHSEWELRALGEKMSRKVSVRKTGRSKPLVLAPKEDTRNLLYGDNPFSNHQYPQALPRSETLDLSRSSNLLLVPETETVPRSARTRVLLDNNLHTDSAKAKGGSSSSSRPDSVSDASVLNDQEMVIMDQNNFINKLQ